jgi:hypothetical protein
MIAPFVLAHIVSAHIWDHLLAVSVKKPPAWPGESHSLTIGGAARFFAIL